MENYRLEISPEAPGPNWVQRHTHLAATRTIKAKSRKLGVGEGIG